MLTFELLGLECVSTSILPGICRIGKRNYFSFEIDCRNLSHISVDLVASFDFSSRSQALQIGCGLSWCVRCRCIRVADQLIAGHR